MRSLPVKRQTRSSPFVRHIAEVDLQVDMGIIGRRELEHGAEVRHLPNARRCGRQPTT
jgi:hypothetical protein